MTPSPPSSPEATATTLPNPASGTSTSKPQSKLVTSPRRLLILTPTSHSLTTIPPLLHTLTGVAVKDPPSATTTVAATTTESEDVPATTTFAGYTTHPPLTIENKYYKAEVSIWVDEIPTSSTDANTNIGTEAKTETEVKGTGAAQWKTEFSGAEARVVRDAIGGVVICLKNPRPHAIGGDTSEEGEREDVQALKDFLRCIGDVKKLIEGERSGDGDGDGEGAGIGFGEVLGLIILVEDRNKNKNTKSKKKGGSDIEDDGGLEETEEPFSISWWEEQLDDIGLMDFDIASWDPSAPDTDIRDKYGGSCPSLLLLHNMVYAN